MMSAALHEAPSLQCVTAARARLRVIAVAISARPVSPSSRARLGAVAPRLQFPRTLQLVDALFGTGPQTITWWQMALRAIVIFFYLLLLLRVGGRRMSGGLTAFDIVVAVLLGAVLGRTVTADSALGPTMAAAAAFVALHWILARLAFERHAFGWLFKGQPDVLVKDGVPQRAAMRRAAITDADLLEALRASTGTDDLSQVRLAYLERSGQISFVRR